MCVFGSELDLYAFIEVHRCTPIRQEVSEKQNQFISTDYTRFLLLFEEEGEEERREARGKGNSAIFWSYFMPAIGGDQKHGPSSLPHAFCFFLSFCLHHSLSLLRKKNRRILSPHENAIESCHSLNGKEFRARF